MDWHFDRDTVRLLRYIYKRKGVTEGEILRKFKNIGVSFTLVNLSIDLYLIAKDENGQNFVYEKGKGPWCSKSSTKWYTTPKSNLVVQSNTANLWKWVMPLIFSAISLLISLASFIFTWLR